MDYVSPVEMISDALAAAESKTRLSVPDLLIRGVLAGAFLGYATSLVFVGLAQGLPGVAGALIFPAGFVMLMLLGLELATGNFALLPAALLDGRISTGGLLRNWAWVFLGNLAGGVLYAFLFYLAITNCGNNNGGVLAEQVRLVAQKKTLTYAALGGAGWATAFVKAVLCNWMVTVGTMLGFASRSTVGKVVAMWLPIATFFAHGYEHSIVNMFAIPTGMLLGAPVSLGQWWLWNQIPVTVGNIAGGALFTGAALWLTHGRRHEQERESRRTAGRTEAAA